MNTPNNNPIVGWMAEVTIRLDELPLASEIYHDREAAWRWIDSKLARFPKPVAYKLLPVRRDQIQ